MRIVAACDAGEGTRKEIAERYGVSLRGRWSYAGRGAVNSDAIGRTRG